MVTVNLRYMYHSKVVVFVGSNVFVGSQKAGHNKLQLNTDITNSFTTNLWL